MTSNDELRALIEQLREHGASVALTYDEELRASEGREVIATVTVSGVRGIGPEPMSPISAAERMREAIYAINAYDGRIEDRRERLEDRAERLQREGAARFKRGRDAMALIPFGQPILIGHHSEKSDRSYRNRAQNNMRAGHELMTAAGDIAARAASVGTGGISSDDPVAVAKLREKLEKLEARQALMAGVNRLVRKFKTKPAEGAQAIAAAYPGTFTETLAAECFKPDQLGRIGFASYELTNNNGNMARIRARIAQLERTATKESAESEVNGVRIVENTEANRLQMFFPGKPAQSVRDELKRAGFRWSPSEGAWQRHLSVNAKWTAEQIAAKGE